jgi:hypothetical protein
MDLPIPHVATLETVTTMLNSTVPQIEAMKAGDNAGKFFQKCMRGVKAYAPDVADVKHILSLREAPTFGDAKSKCVSVCE